MVFDWGRWSFRVRIDDRTITLEGEMMVSGSKPADYLIFSSSVKSWDPPFENEIIDDRTKQDILKAAVEGLISIGRVPEVV
jgi:hypothetical protein